MSLCCSDSRPEHRTHEICNFQFYFFAAQIITEYSGKTFQDFVKERILDPLNMTSTTYSAQEANSTGHLSQSWAFVGRRIPIIIEDAATSNLIAGAGGLLSNAVDMVRASSSTACSHLLTSFNFRANGQLQSSTGALTR